uniref:hypothetical protein n=1 Tax=Parerythrobacter lutipelagi TaxID=1964208 RepID=UPI0010F7B59F|nr:hypothetical protein [Parerythrobacter lutipelagi]
MANRFLERVLKGNEGAIPSAAPPSAVPPLGGTRSEAVHRLQVGLSGIASVVLIVALADTIMSRADESEASAVPEAAATVEPFEGDSPRNDPLSEAGLVPDLPTSPTPSPTASSAVVPAEGGPVENN